jgi:hypothetical protein
LLCLSIIHHSQTTSIKINSLPPAPSIENDTTFKAALIPHHIPVDMPATDSIKSYQSIPNDENEHLSKPIAKTIITALGAIRAVGGAGLLIAPIFVGKVFHVPITAQSSLVARAVGTRDLVLGELLLTADTKSKDRTEVKRALWAGIATDALDIGATVFAIASGNLSKTGAGLFGGGATAFLLLGLVGLRSLN